MEENTPSEWYRIASCFRYISIWRRKNCILFIYLALFRFVHNIVEGTIRILPNEKRENYGKIGESRCFHNFIPKKNFTLFDAWRIHSVNLQKIFYFIVNWFSKMLYQCFDKDGEAKESVYRRLRIFKKIFADGKRLCHLQETYWKSVTWKFWISPFLCKPTITTGTLNCLFCYVCLRHNKMIVGNRLKK